MNKDTLFDTLQQNLVDFRFDEKVVNVFADMVKRSVPGYQTMLQMMPLFAEHYAQQNSRFYDLGCSLGAVSLALDLGRGNQDIDIIAVDNSAAMVEKCRKNLAHLTKTSVICQDITELKIINASVVVINLTLQFINPHERQALINTIYQGLNMGGVLVLSEKIHDNNTAKQALKNTLHLNFKRANGYSELAIAQKRNALEKTLITESEKTHINRLKKAGFNEPLCWFQCFNFASFIAVK